MDQSTRNVTALCLTLALTLTACAAPDEEGGSGITIVVSTTILGDVTANLVGGAASVEVLIPIGVDPHDYQLSSAQVAAVQIADLVVVNGLSLEEGMLDAIDALIEDGANVLEIGPMVDPIPLWTGDGLLDPHMWMDPLRMATAVDLIVDRLELVDDSIDWAAMGESYRADLVDLDREISMSLSSVVADDRKLVTSHDSLGYLADRYGFELVGVVVPGGSSLGDPSSSELAELVRTMLDENVSVVFADTASPTALAQAVTAELGRDAEVVELYTGSLGEQGSGAETYLGMLRVNAQRIARALS